MPRCVVLTITTKVSACLTSGMDCQVLCLLFIVMLFAVHSVAVHSNVAYRIALCDC